MHTRTEWNCWSCGYHYDLKTEPVREEFTVGRVPDPHAPPLIPCIICPKCYQCMGCPDTGDREVSNALVKA